MKDGSVLRRSYWVDLSREDLDDPATLTGQLQELVNTPEFLVTYRLEELVGPEELHLTGGLLEYYETGQYDMLQERSFSAVDAETLREALLQDAQAGHLEGIQLMALTAQPRKSAIQTDCISITISTIPTPGTVSISPSTAT